MKIVVGKTAFLKLLIIAVFSILIGTLSLIGGRQKAAAASSGPSPSHTSAPMEDNCTSCHSDFGVNSGSGGVQITGVPVNYTPGQQVVVTVTTAQEDAVIYGFQITAVDSTGQGAGTFTLPAQNPMTIQLKDNTLANNIVRNYVEHTSDGLSNGQFGSNYWTFTWTAPAQPVGKVDFYAAGNAANSDSSTSGDYIYTTTVSSLPMAAPLVSVGGKVFTPSGLSLRSARVILTDQNNIQRSATTSSFGQYNFTQVQSGQTYTVTVQSKRYRFTPQVLSVNNALTNVDFTGLE